MLHLDKMELFITIGPGDILGRGISPVLNGFMLPRKGQTCSLAGVRWNPTLLLNLQVVAVANSAYHQRLLACHLRPCQDTRASLCSDCNLKTSLTILFAQSVTAQLTAGERISLLFLLNSPVPADVGKWGGVCHLSLQESWGPHQRCWRTACSPWASGCAPCIKWCVKTPLYRRAFNTTFSNRFCEGTPFSLHLTYQLWFEFYCLLLILWFGLWFYFCKF